MEWTIDSFVEARETVSALLRELDLEAYGFEVEPRGETWEIRIECPAVEGWKMLTLTVAPATLESTQHDPAARRDLLTAWRARLDACRHA